MRTLTLLSVFLAAGAFTLSEAMAPVVAQQQSQQAGPQPATPKAYKIVPVKMPQPVSDPSFDAFRQQLADIAQKKDRAALGRLIWRNFFWFPDDKDVADKSKPGIDNFGKAIGLVGNDPPGWEVLSSYAGENTADPLNDPQRPNVICGPGAPVFEETPFDELLAATQTEPAEWGYPGSDGVEVRSGPQANAPVTEKLGMHLVRAYPDELPAGAVNGDTLRIVTPSGKVGFIGADFLLPLASDQLCYVKDGAAWKIAGVLGGTPSQ